MQTALKVMKKNLEEVKQKMSECVSQYGYVKNTRKYEYQKLIKQAEELREGISYLENEVYNIGVLVDSRLNINN